MFATSISVDPSVDALGFIQNPLILTLVLMLMLMLGMNAAIETIVFPPSANAKIISRVNADTGCEYSLNVNR